MSRLSDVIVASLVKWSQRKRRAGRAVTSPMGWPKRPLRLARERV